MWESRELRPQLAGPPPLRWTVNRTKSFGMVTKQARPLIFRPPYLNPLPHGKAQRAEYRDLIQDIFQLAGEDVSYYSAQEITFSGANHLVLPYF